VSFSWQKDKTKIETLFLLQEQFSQELSTSIHDQTA
jgi:hypothetical protein